MTPRVSFAVDYGARRIGVARCDSDRILALPVATITADKYGGHLDELMDLIAEYEASDVFVGLPSHLSGAEGASADAARRFARALARRIAQPVRLIDERLTTVQAHAQLSEAGRSSRDRRSVIDQASAVILLEHVLETERRTGAIPGRVVT